MSTPPRSGTTGRPKGVLKESPFPPFGTGVGLELLMQGMFGFNEDTVYLCPAPLYHAAPLGWSMGTTRLGGTVVGDAALTLDEVFLSRIGTG